METTRKFVYGLFFGLAVLVGMGISSCKKDEPQPVIVENPLDATVYYIMGRVTANDQGLAGVKVSVLIPGGSVETAADGSFQLPVKEKGAHAVSFSKSGYITVTAEAMIDQSTKKSSSIVLSQEMVEANPPVTVKPDVATEITEARNSLATLSIPAGSVKTATDVSITEFYNGGKSSVNHLGLSTLACSPDGLKFEKPVSVSIKNAASSAVSFAQVRHYAEENGKWVDKGAASFDAANNVYKAELSGFSNHSFGPKCVAASKGVSQEAAEGLVVDNLGKMEPVEKPVTAVQKMGWTISDDLVGLIKSRLAGISDADATALATRLRRAVGSVKGSPSGVTSSSLVLGTAKVSGDTKMTIDFKNNLISNTLTFSINYKGSVVPLTLTVATYLGISTTVTYQYGPSRTDHSGGGGK